MPIISAAVTIIPTLIESLSKLFSLSTSTDASYTISLLLSKLSGVHAEIASGKFDEEKIRKQLEAIRDELQKFETASKRNAPEETQRILAEASRSIAQITTSR